MQTTRRATIADGAPLTSANGLLNARIIHLAPEDAPLRDKNAQAGDCLLLALTGTAELRLPDRSIILDQGDSVHSALSLIHI